MTPPFAVDAMALRFFLLLLAGHLLSDFLFQSARIARDKGRRVGVLFEHGFWTFVVHAAVLFPFWNGQVLLGLAVLALAHIGIDWLKPRINANEGKTLYGFFLDQGFHLATLIALGWALHYMGAARTTSMSPGLLDTYVRAMVIAAGFAFNGKGGTAVVRLLLGRFPDISGPLRADRSGAYAMGLIIGNLERFILYLLVLLGHWGALGFVIAAKSIARFKELDEKGFADYYLIGTLVSVLVALISGVTAGMLMELL
jgi:hypothetical protein